MSDVKSIQGFKPTDTLKGQILKEELVVNATQIPNVVIIIGTHTWKEPGAPGSEK